MESKKKNKIAIIGAGPAGCMCAYYAQNNCEITIFEAKEPLKTLLYTGGGRCNFAYAEFDFKELAKHYPRGEKFLISVFSQFNAQNSIDFMEELGIKTYSQEDRRMFPKSNSAKEIRDKFLLALNKCKIKKEKITEIKKIDNHFILNKKYEFDKVVISTGGHAGYELAKSLGHTIIAPKPALLGLITKEKYKNLQGVTLHNVKAQIKLDGAELPKTKHILQDDLLFTHKGISGPLAYIVSSLCARCDYNKNNPIIMTLDFLEKDTDFQEILNSNSKKYVKNMLTAFIPKSFAEYILEKCKLEEDILCHQIDAKTRKKLVEYLTNFKITITGHVKEGEVVTSGGVDLKEINSKTMESKFVKNLYFCGEIIDVDGFCGGFNLQNCWSTGYVAGNSI